MKWKGYADICLQKIEFISKKNGICYVNDLDNLGLMHSLNIMLKKKILKKEKSVAVLINVKQLRYFQIKSYLSLYFYIVDQYFFWYFTSTRNFPKSKE